MASYELLSMYDWQSKARRRSLLSKRQPLHGYLVSIIKILSKMLNTTKAFLAVVFCAVCCCSSSFADFRDDVGYTKLVSVLGAAAPNGAGVPISLVEAGSTGNFLPNASNAEFDAISDPLMIDVAFTNGSSAVGSGSSGHSNSQAQLFFGNASSVAPAANTVTVYEANDYLSNILNMNGSNSTLPDAQGFRVQNFSWIGTFATPNDGTPDPTVAELNNDREALRRFDYAIDTNNITAMVGLNNGTAALPHMLSHSYNSIAIGLRSGIHSSGLTHLANYGVGRSKPELVANRNTVSGATSSVSSVATFLHSADTVMGTDAAKSVTMKALLLAGASKDELSSWSHIDTSGEWHPLDDTFGAGEVNVYNSYLATLGGQFVGNTEAPTQVASHGWDYQTVQAGPGNELLYDFIIPAGTVASELSIALTWNAKIESPFNVGDPIVANLGLELVDDSDMTIDLDLGDTHVDGLSDSDVDNVEYLYLTNLVAGTYTLKVSSSDLDSDFGLAWRTVTAFETISADFDEDGDTDGADFLAWQRGLGTLINATHATGDADGDGDVDADDLAIFNGVTTGPTSLSSLLASVPEPEGWILICVGVLLAIGLRGYRLRTGVAS